MSEKIQVEISRKLAKPDQKAKVIFYLIRGGAYLLIHIFPIFLLTYFLVYRELLANFILYGLFSIFYSDLRPAFLKYTADLFIPLLIYITTGIVIWALIVWPAVRKYFPPLFLDTDGVEYREGRVWWRQPNKYTDLLKNLAGRAGIEYKVEKLWFYRCGKLISPFRPLRSVNKLYIPSSVEKDIEITQNRIVFHNLMIMKYKDGYILVKTTFNSKEIDIKKEEEKIKRDVKKISELVGDYALTNAELRVKNVSSALFWVPPANLEVKEHIHIPNEGVGYKILDELIQKYDASKDKALKDGIITPEEITNMLLPLFNQILEYVNSMKAIFGEGVSDLPDPPKLKDNLITLQEIDGYINAVRAAIEIYNNPEVWR